MSGAIIRVLPLSTENNVSVSLFDISLNENVFEINLPQPKRRIRACCVNSQLSKLFAAKRDNVMIYCMVTKSLLASINVGVVVDDLVVNCSGTKFLACDEDEGDWGLWDVETESKFPTVEWRGNPVFSCDGRFIINVDSLYCIQVWDTESNTAKLVDCDAALGYSVHPFNPKTIVHYNKYGWVVRDLDSAARVEARNSSVKTLKLGSQQDILYAQIERDLQLVLVAWSLTTGEDIFVVKPSAQRWTFDYNPADDTLIVTNWMQQKNSVLICSYTAASGELLHEMMFENCRAKAFMRTCAHILL